MGLQSKFVFLEKLLAFHKAVWIRPLSKILGNIAWDPFLKTNKKLKKLIMAILDPILLFKKKEVSYLILKAKQYSVGFPKVDRNS